MHRAETILTGWRQTFQACAIPKENLTQQVHVQQKHAAAIGKCVEHCVSIIIIINIFFLKTDFETLYTCL